MAKTEKNLTQFNDQNYYFELILVNSKGESFAFNNSAIEELVIEDDVFSFFTTGTLIFQNNFDSIERTYYDGEKLIKGYEFGTTNRDYLIFRCIPRFFEGLPEDELDPNVWELNHFFVIYDFEDIEGSNPEDKYKKIYFWDAYYENFVEKNLHFSSALLQKEDTNNIPPSQQDDDTKTEYTGNIIKEIIKQTLSEEEVFLDSEDEDENKWDIGRDKLFYTSSPQFKAIDDLNYVLFKHCSNDEFNNDPCILSRHRYKNEWTLIPYSKYFDKAINSVDPAYPSALQLEYFIISEYGDPIDSKTNRDRVPRVGKTPNLQINMHFSDYSLIDKYKIYDMTLFDKVNSLNTHVSHSYDYKNKSFSIKQNDSNIESAYDHFKTNYSDKLNYSDFENIPLFNIENLRRYNKNIKQVFDAGYGKENPIHHLGRNQILKDSLGLNTTIQFSSRGLTHRKSGHFISISKNAKYHESEYESKLQGQWFLTKVEHKFTKESYTNNMFAVKINKFKVSDEQ